MQKNLKEEWEMSVSVSPLTRRDERGRLYKRAKEVDQQIAKALRLDESILVEQIDSREPEGANLFQDECLVYLIRHFRRKGQNDLVGTLMSSTYG